MLRTAKSIWILFWASLLTLVLFLPIVAAALLGKRGDAAFRGTQVFAWAILKLTGIRLSVTGREHIVPGQRYVILSNHASYFDPPALVLALGLEPLRGPSAQEQLQRARQAPWPWHQRSPPRFPRSVRSSPPPARCCSLHS